MSRAYNARRKVRRRQSEPVDEPQRRLDWLRPRRLTVLIPITAVIAILVAVGALGFQGGSGVDRRQVRHDVTTLLAGIPQKGAVLGSPKAPITITMFGDMECPTVQRFAEVYLPYIVRTWVRPGDVKIVYRSLKTDTSDEQTFYRQEIAGLAAGRQRKMWNFLLTFLREQEQGDRNYATEEFLTGIAAQVPGLKATPWRRDRKGTQLFNHVALGVHMAHEIGFGFTPSFAVDVADAHGPHRVGSESTHLVQQQVEASLRKDVTTLGEESSRDSPKLGTFDSYRKKIGEIEAR